MHAAVLWLPIALRRRSARFRDSPEGASRMPHSSSTCTDNDQLSAPFAAEAFRQFHRRAASCEWSLVAATYPYRQDNAGRR